MNTTKRTAIIASYRRPIPLLKTLESLIDQVDEIKIALNETPPKESAGKLLFRFIEKHRDKIEVLHLDNTYGDGARYTFPRPSGWILTCDDDITYGPGYVDHMIAKAIEYGPVLITAHGVNLKPGRRGSLLDPADRIAKYPCLMEVDGDHVVEVGGTGVMCWHSDTFWPDLSRFKRRNMADLWVAVQAREHGIPIVCVDHRHGWLTTHLPSNWPTIWEQSFYSEEIRDYHASIFNKHFR